MCHAVDTEGASRADPNCKRIILQLIHHVSCSGLEKELAELIQTDQIQARIDSHNKVLYARHADQRKATFQSALRTGGPMQCSILSLGCHCSRSHVFISHLYLYLTLCL